ncbi:hypothetical protein [Oenococcus sp.]|uniref:hypothetical protein n=1 Tax=Oenococcus sp. TaxID=1979414 RepID=UPI0039EBB402
MNINNIHVNGNPMFGNGTQNNNGGVNNQVKIYYDQGANLEELTNLLEKISNNDKQMFIALVNSINDKGEYDTSKSKSLFERFPALKKGFNTIIDIVTQYGVSAGIAYIKSKFPVIF